MKFECDKSLLSAAIDGVSRAITNRAAIPVLEGIYLKAEGFQLTLTGYDMEMGIPTKALIARKTSLPENAPSPCIPHDIME